MSVLALVRHGQASFFAEEYDQLSPVGIDQALHLGDYWARRGVVFDEVYVGPRQRQQQTAEFVGTQFRLAGLPWPDPIKYPELDEYDLEGLMGRKSASLARQDEDFQRLVVLHKNCTDEHERLAHFQRMFERLLTHWQTSPDDDELVESWRKFRDRVRRGLDRITGREGRGRNVVAFTSGGFIGAAVALVLGAPDQSALALNWRVRNASLTWLMFTHGRLTLDEFNTAPHLIDPSLWTYR